MDEVPPAEPTCADYCAAITAACTGDQAQYSDESECYSYCSAWGAFPKGSVADTSGNTLGCRLYHAGVAATEAPTIHCPHAGPSGGGVCGNWCDGYCHLALKNCKGGNTLYASEADCQSACADFPATGSPGDTGGDNVQCRIYHLGLAGSDWPTSAGIHCSHGAEDG